MQLLSILPLISLLPLTLAQTCYFPNGSPLPDDGSFYSSMRPCTTPGLETICCATDRSNPPGSDVALPGNIQDECLPNGLCQNRKVRNGSDWTTFHANYCTSPNFTSPSCLSICDQTRGTGGGTRVTPCTGKADSERWCCGDTSACCVSNVGVVKLAQIFGHVSSSSSIGVSVSASMSTSSVSTASTSLAESGSQGVKSEGEGDRGMSGGVIAGVVVGALAGLAVLAAVILFALRRRSNVRSGRLEFAEGSVAPPQYRQHEESRYEKDADNQVAEMEQPRSELAGGSEGVHEKADNNGARGRRTHQIGFAELSGSEVRQY